MAYYNAAGIPDLNGNPWSSNSPNILDEEEIAAGGLFEPGTHLPAAQVRHLRDASQQRLRLLAHRPDEPRHEDVRPAGHVRAAGRRLDCALPLDPEQREQHRRPDAERQPGRQEPVQDVARRRPAGWLPDHQRLPRRSTTPAGPRRSTRPKPTCRSRRWRPRRRLRRSPAGRCRRGRRRAARVGRPTGRAPSASATSTRRRSITTTSSPARTTAAPARGR